MRLVVHVAQAGGKLYIYIFFENLKGRDFLGDRSSNQMLTLKLCLTEMLFECGDWTKLAKSTLRWWAGLNVLGAST